MSTPLASETVGPEPAVLAARTVDLAKTYGRGETEVHALRRGVAGPHGRAVQRRDVPVGLRHVDAAALHGRARHADQRHHPHWRHRLSQPNEKQLTRLRRDRIGIAVVLAGLAGVFAAVIPAGSAARIDILRPLAVE